MVANAVADATGLRITSMPITAEKVAMALLEPV
jgi:CO/xanthine dehydrogenase Mo-binding subunit